MLVYFKKYVIYSCVIAALLPVIVSTVWPLAFGTLMMASIEGLLISLVLFFGGFTFSTRYFGRKAEAETMRLISLYNVDCDPAAFVEQGAELARAIRAPFGERGSWFLSFYAQALLDLARIDDARAIEAGMYESVSYEKKQMVQAAVVVNLVPLALKLLGAEATVPIIDQAFGLLGEASDADTLQRRAYLNNQRALAVARIEGNDEELCRIYEAMRTNEGQIMRIRVEYTWDEARVHYKRGNRAGERLCLDFVARNGNKLALVKPAEERLAAMASEGEKA